MGLKLSTKSDARTWFTNSGVIDWQWFEGFSEESLINFMLKNADGIKSESELIAEFLIINDENPKEYGV